MLSQEIADGVSKSTQAVQAAEAGVRQIGALARQQTICMLDAATFLLLPQTTPPPLRPLFLFPKTLFFDFVYDC